MNTETTTSIETVNNVVAEAEAITAEATETVKPTETVFTYNGADVLTIGRLMHSVALSCSADASRPVLNGVLFKWDIQGDLTLAATDSYTLATANVNAPASFNHALELTADIERIVNGKALVKFVKEVLKAYKATHNGKSCVLSITVPHDDMRPVSLKFTSAVTEFSTTIESITGQFPNYKGLVPDLKNDVGIMPTEPFAFNPRFLKRLADTSAALEGCSISATTLPVRFHQADSSKPALIRMIVRDIGSLEFVLMPVRIS